jgi:hypothetical protein
LDVDHDVNSLGVNFFSTLDFWSFLVKGFPKFPGSLKIFILDSYVDGGGDFIHREFFQALGEGKRSQKLGQHRSL